MDLNTMSTQPEAVLLQGAELLKPLFSSHGFTFVEKGGSTGSGGPFVSAEFKRGDRKFEIHYRFSLGMVTYHLASQAISHEQYMCSVLGKPGMSHYPGFSNDPLDAFRHLRDDLQSYCSEFLEGTNEAFMRRIQHARSRWASKPKLPE